MGAIQRLVQRARQVSAASEPDVPSPCVSVCRMDPHTEWCEGCFRTLDEIAGWSAMDDGDRRAVWRSIGERALTAAVAQGRTTDVSAATSQAGKKAGATAALSPAGGQPKEPA